MSTAVAPRREHTATWTVLGRRLRVTSNHAKRAQILAAIRDMEWHDRHSETPEFTHPAINAVITAIFGRQCSSLAKMATTVLDEDRTLIGLQHAEGARSYLVVQGSEAILVLVDADPAVADVA